MKGPRQTAAVDLTTAQAAQTAIKVFDNIADAWALSVPERLRVLGVSRSVYQRHRRGQGPHGLGEALQLRLSHVLRIYAALAVLLPVAEQAHAWVRRVNSAPLFAGASALQLMQRGGVEGLRRVADYLDAQGGDFS